MEHRIVFSALAQVAWAVALPGHAGTPGAGALGSADQVVRCARRLAQSPGGQGGILYHNFDKSLR